MTATVGVIVQSQTEGVGGTGDATMELEMEMDSSYNAKPGI